MNGQTRRDVARLTVGAAATPAFCTAAPRPGALEWVAACAERRGAGWGATTLVHLTSEGARLLDEAPPDKRMPGVVRLVFLTADWLYTDGARRPQLIHLKTGARRPCPLDGKMSEVGLMLCAREHAVFDLNTGELAPLYPGDAPEEGRSVQSISADGATALVSTPEALEWWTITRASGDAGRRQRGRPLQAVS